MSGGWRSAALAALLSLCAAKPGMAEPLNVGTVIAETIAAVPGCINYCIVGACFWLDCDWDGCDVRVSTKIRHYNPDLYVSAFPETGADPWLEIRATLGLATQAVAGAVGGLLSGFPIGGGQPSSTGEHSDTGLRFHEVNVIGHPLAGVFGNEGLSMLGLDFLCPSQATPFVPYFVSTLDAAAWRLQIPELLYPQSWIPGLREIGPWPRLSWGAVYPRSGFVTAPEQPKAAAVAAQRAADIVTRIAQPHVYFPVVLADFDEGVWPPDEIVENDPDSGKWSMLTPLPLPYCSAFAQDDSPVGPGWAAGKGSSDGSYAWTLWRRYTCCLSRGDLLLFTIEFPPICLN